MKKLVHLLAIPSGIILGFCAGIIFYNLIFQGSITLHLQFGWNGLLIFFAIVFALFGAGVGRLIGHSLNSNTQNLPAWSNVMVVGLVIILGAFLYILASFVGFLSHPW